MSDRHIVRLSRAALARTRGRTDWERLKATTDGQIDAAVASDPDWRDDGVDWSKAEVVAPPAKTAVSIRLDEDVLAFFRSGGPGYQTRINAVLRAYMKAKSG